MGRYGHGVYFAAEASVSMGTYARASNFNRAEADFPVMKATALVEIGRFHVRLSYAANDKVNVPETFVSRNPFYVGKLDHVFFLVLG